MAGYTIQVPKITAAVMTPNPVGFNAVLRVSITITEQSIVLEPVFDYSGERFSGEDAPYGN